MPTMLRSRNRDSGPIRASSYQYAPRFLLYRRGSEFDHIPDHVLANAIKSKLPPEVRAGWMVIARNMVHGPSERSAEEAAAWISRHGKAAGFRTPNVRERARAMGMGSYLTELGLNEQEMYDARSTLKRWLYGCGLDCMSGRWGGRSRGTCIRR